MSTTLDNTTVAFQSFFSSQGINAQVVYSTGCGKDTSPSEYFPGARIIYVDIDKQEIEHMRQLGHEAYVADVDVYTPPVLADIIFVRNGPQPNNPLECLTNKGCIVCNNWVGTADELRADARFTLIGVINPSPQGEEVSLDTDDFHLHWETVETDEELMEVGGYSHYQRRIIQSTSAGVVQDYTQLLQTEEAKDPTDRMVLISLPKKRGNGTSSLYIFQRSDSL